MKTLLLAATLLFTHLTLANETCKKIETALCPNFKPEEYLSFHRCLVKKKKLHPKICQDELEKHMKSRGKCYRDIVLNCNEPEVLVAKNYSCLLKAGDKLHPDCRDTFSRMRSNSQSILSTIKQKCAAELAGPCNKGHIDQSLWCLGPLSGEGKASPRCTQELMKYWKGNKRI